jgi:phospho-N-acetylmuramoyl-pentapeptide-transferase
MLYLLLYRFHAHYVGLGVLRYETFRSVMAGLTALAISLALGPYVIGWLRAASWGQTIRDEVPQTHQKKAGTATMGGLLILASCVFATILLADIRDPYVWIAIFVAITFGGIGFTDDRLKLKRGRGQGITGRQKIGWSFFFAFVAMAFLFIVVRFDTHLTIPFAKNLHPDLRWWGYIPFAMLVIVGASHSVNLTDGLDGLAIGPIMTVALTYWVFTYVAGNLKFATYLAVPHIVGIGEVAIFCAALVAASLGFLWFNAYPASMMMGDVGALSLGGAIGTVAVLAKQELALIIAGGIFVVETLSVIIQVYYFKLTHKRVFLMAPLHHHFELKGWPETIVVIRFWIISIVCALVALSTLKLR